MDRSITNLKSDYSPVYTSCKLCSAPAKHLMQKQPCDVNIRIAFACSRKNIMFSQASFEFVYGRSFLSLMLVKGSTPEMCVA